MTTDAEIIQQYLDFEARCYGTRAGKNIAEFEKCLWKCGGDVDYMKSGIEQEGADFLRDITSDEFGIDDEGDADDSLARHQATEGAAWRFIKLP